MKRLLHPLAAVVVLALTGPGLGYRHLWQDEIETAERARTILESGYPRVIDRSGTLSVNAGGREIEDSDAHRYSPWGQLYWAAPGLAAARLLGASPDAGVRAPFALAHAATSGLVSYGLSAVAGLAPFASAGIAVALGVQSVRVAHDRTARYHALLDLFAVAGLLGVGLLARRRSVGLPLVAASILVLPHVHTLAGAAYALCIGALGAVRLVQLSRREGTVPHAIRQGALFIAVPGIVTLALLLVLTRPWAQAAWGTLYSSRFRSLKDLVHVSYGLYAGVAALPLLFWRRHRSQALLLAIALALIVATVRVLDLHPFSQTRYYLTVPLFGLLWPMYAGLDGFGARERRVVTVLLALAVLLPDVVIGPMRREPFRSFHGVRVAWADAAAGSTRQPLHEAMEYVRAHGQPSDPVLVDYVPQLANWYLPDHPIALLPDAFARTPLNAGHPVWEKTPPMPRWHLTYSGDPVGLWICGDGCDYGATERNAEEGTYVLTSKRLGRSVSMCVVARFPTEKWLNAPFRLLSPEAFLTAGGANVVLQVATPCDGVGDAKRRPNERRPSAERE